MGRTTVTRAQDIARGYISPNHRDAEMTRFAMSGQADGWELLQCIEHSARQIETSDQYSDDERAEISAELDYLRGFVREYHGRYVIEKMTTVTGDGDGDGDDVTTYEMFETLRDVADHLYRFGMHADGSALQSGPDEHYVAGMADGVAVPVYRVCHYRATPVHGFTDRTWAAVVATVTR